MTTRPITLSPDQIRAALAGRLHQVRVPIDPKPHEFVWIFRKTKSGQWQGYERDSDRNRERGPLIDSPLGTIGDRVWVREKFGPTKQSHLCKVSEATYVCFPDGSQKFKNGEYYQQPADRPFGGNWPKEWRWSPSHHMPQWASRITLELTGVMVERDEAGKWSWVYDVRKVGE